MSGLEQIKVSIGEFLEKNIEKIWRPWGTVVCSKSGVRNIFSSPSEIKRLLFIR